MTEGLPAGEVTRLLAEWSGGDREAFQKLIPMVYAELHRIARRAWVGGTPGQTLQPTALINEVYLKLVNTDQPAFNGRSHFFAVASIAMRHILVNYAKSSLAAKRGGGQVVLSLDAAEGAAEKEASEVLALHDALELLQRVDARKSRVVELRYFGGLSIEETAEVLGVSIITVNRDWQMARAWLKREITRAD